jgi:hypothetical protein
MRPVQALSYWVAAMNAAEENAAGVLAGGHGKEMDVVGHQTPTQQGHAGIDAIFSQKPQVGQAIRFRGKGLAAIDAVLREVARHSRQHATLGSWHNAFEYDATTIWDAQENPPRPGLEEFLFNGCSIRNRQLQAAPGQNRRAGCARDVALSP